MILKNIHLSGLGYTLYQNLDTTHNKKWITLINGHMRPGSDFKSIATKLSELGASVMTNDNRASGTSTYDNTFSIKDLADDIIKIWDHEEIRTSVVIGISMGGAIAQELVRQSSQRIEKLGLVSTAHTLKDLPEWTTLDLIGLTERFAKYVHQNFYKRNPLLIQSMAKQTLSAIENDNFLERAALQRNAIYEFSPLEQSELIEFKAPTFILHGQDDMIVPYQEAKDLANFFSGSKLAILPETGHLILAERNRELLNWITEIF